MSKPITNAVRKSRSTAPTIEAIEAKNVDLQTQLQSLFDSMDDLYAARDTFQGKTDKASKEQLFATVRAIDDNRTSQKRVRKAIRTLHRKTDKIVHNCDRACCQHKLS